MGKIEGDVYKLPPQRFSRERYVELAEVINNAGGKWCRKAKGFIFKGSPEAFRRALASGETVNVQQVTQFFPTPADVAYKMVQMANLNGGAYVLEPSAGRGAIALQIQNESRNRGLGVTCTMIEKEASNCGALINEFSGTTGWHVLQRDFLECTPPGSTIAYDAVIMNPPFTRGSDIKHILHAWDFLKRGGKLVALCANGPKQNEMLRPFCESLGGTWEVLPAGTFKDSGDKGTNIETVLLTAYA